MRLESAVSARRAVETARPSRCRSSSSGRAGLFYTPVVIHWLMLGLRYGDFSLPTAANPRITTGGLCGESKLSILSQIGPAAQDLVAPACGVSARPDGAAAAEAAMAAVGLHYPVVAKPDIGCNGTGVRLVRDRAAMTRYLQAFPPGETVVLQHYVDEPNEAGIFYVRHPDEARGTDHLADDQAAAGGGGRRPVHAAGPDHGGRTGAAGAASLPGPLGGQAGYRSGSRARPCNWSSSAIIAKARSSATARALVTPALTDAIERLARAMPDFFFGRIDVRFASAASLRQGTGFQVIEINGVGSEATHIWDPVHQAAGCVAHAVLPLRRGVPHRRGQPAARVCPLGGADDVPRLAEPAAADGALSAERLRPWTRDRWRIALRSASWIGPRLARRRNALRECGCDVDATHEEPGMDATPEPAEIEELERTAAWRLRLVDADPADTASAAAARLLEALAEDLRRNTYASLWTELRVDRQLAGESDAISDYAELAADYRARIGVSAQPADGADYLRGLLAIAHSLV